MDTKKGNFRFKRFEVTQQRAAMKVGTDGVLLGAWTELPERVESILDVGTGTGVIALMLAQRTENNTVPTRIDAIEIETEAAAEAEENFEASPWGERLNIYTGTFQRYASESPGYDLIVSNPPYFLAGNDYRRGRETPAATPSRERIIARHAESLPYDELIEGVKKVLKPTGRFAAIFPYQESGIFIAKAAAAGLYCNRMLEIYALPDKPVKRIAAEFSLHRSESGARRERLVIHDPRTRDYTEAYRRLTRDFYLRF